MDHELLAILPDPRRCGTGGARSQIRVVVMKQVVYFDEWVPLGSYRFGDSAEEHVRLTDATGEDPNTLRKIGFDAVKWELESPCTATATPTTTATPTPTVTARVYLPLVVKDYGFGM